MAPLYDPQYISRYYDLYADREWQRFEVDVAGRMNFLTHRRLLEEYVRPGTSVLDVGAGPGRFSIELAHLGARVTVGDISPGQLALHREKTEEAGVEESIVGRHVVDIVDLSTFATDSFDAVVCYGGPLSYVMERADTAVGELLRVTRPGGHLLVSVMSLPGATRRFLEGVFELGQHSTGARLSTRWCGRAISMESSPDHAATSVICTAGGS